MFNLFNSKMYYVEKEMNEFITKINNTKNNQENLLNLFKEEFKFLGYDEVFVDKFGFVVGIFKGYKKKNDILLLSQINRDMNEKSNINNLNSILSNYIKEQNFQIKKCDLYNAVAQMYSVALLKRTLLPIEGNVIVACVIKDSNNICLETKYLFDKILKDFNANIKYVLLGQPTGLNVYTGNKGEFEYQVDIKVKMDKNILKKYQDKIYEYVYPAINRLEELNSSMPMNFEMGKSRLKVVDVACDESKINDKFMKFGITVKRVFVPEESPNEILLKAKSIVSHLYTSNNVEVTAKSVDEKMDYGIDSEIIVKDAKPWKIEANDSFVLSSLEALQNVEITSAIGCWKERVTAGSFTYGELKIPTIGFGAGDENNLNEIENSDLSKSIIGAASIIQNTIGTPTFGWSSDEI